MRQLIIQGISEMMEEIELSRQNIAIQALEHIHAKYHGLTSEIIMTIGCSKIVAHFLTLAAKSIKFQVIIAETAPLYI